MWRDGAHHEVEKTNGFDESETKNGVREELATERWVAGNSLEESGEDQTNTDTCDQIRQLFPS